MDPIPVVVQSDASAGALAGWVLGWAAAVAAAAWLTARIIPWLRRHGAVVPASAEGGDRGMPRGGGLVIVAVVLVAALGVCAVDRDAAVRLAGGLLPAAGVAIVSLRDDFRPLPALGRLAVHVAAAAAATATLGPVSEITVPSLGTMQLGAAAWPCTIVWIAGLTNAFNFMDGIDGIAGIVTAAIATALAVAAATLGMPAAAIVSTALSAAALGFLSCNWHPARVFMGDVGSTWCGFLVAVLPLVPPAGAGRAALLQVAACAAWPFLFDTGWTLLKRIWHFENVLVAHRGHIYQRLVSAGWSHRGVATLYGGLTALAGAVAVAPLLDDVLRSTADTVALAGICVGAALLLILASDSVKAERQRAPSS
jgi:UDP-N-acetylmuramyl pentapeptide phosphotransferase/UDP-N-acetylglucosamine-1-phosphate transferase